MKHTNLKAFSILLFLFLCDISFAARIPVNADFILAGTIFIALYISFPAAFILAVFFGMVRDAFLFNSIPVSAVILALTVISMHYFLKYFRHKISFEFLAASLAIFLNIIAASLASNTFSFWFGCSFFLQTYIIFLAVRFLSLRWISPRERDIER